MKHEKILQEIEQQLMENRVALSYSVFTNEKESLRKNNNLLGKIKTILKSADKEYERGCEDAWNIALKKIFLPTFEGGYSCSEYKEIFGYAYISDILRNLKPQEAIAKIKDYEKKKEEAEKKKIKIGDVVVNEAWNNPFIVTKIDDFIEGIDETGHMCKFIWPNDLIHKMGNAAGVFDKFKMNKED